MKRLPRLSPVLRLSLGLTSLVVSLVLFLDLAGVLPDRTEMMRQVRQRTSESLAVQAAATLQSGDMGALLKTLREVRTRDAQILSVALRRSDGVVVVQAGEHGAHWDGRRWTFGSSRSHFIALWMNAGVFIFLSGRTAVILNEPSSCFSRFLTRQACRNRRM